MNMYMWYSEYLKDWGYGRIIVCANSIEEAREIAINHNMKEFDYGGGDTLDVFMNDIAAEPVVKSCIFIDGWPTVKP